MNLEKEKNEWELQIKNEYIANVISELSFLEKLYLYFGDEMSIHKAKVERHRDYLREVVKKGIQEDVQTKNQ